MGPILIAGAGAIGCWLAGRLAAAGETVHLLARTDRATALETHGLTVVTLPEADPSGRGWTEHFPATALGVHSDPTKGPLRPELLVVATRAYQTESMCAELVAAGVRPQLALTLQNGLGNAEALASAFGADRVLVGTTSHGVTFEAPTTVRHAGLGDTRIGAWSDGADRTAEVAAVLHRAGIQVEVVDDPRRALWLKVAVNAAINPPTAIHEVLNGALLDGGPLEEALRSAAREVARVARAEGVPLEAEEAESAAVTVARRTAQNRSSMLQARLAGRPLETEAITGEVVRRAARHGIPVPVNEGHLIALRRL